MKTIEIAIQIVHLMLVECYTECPLTGFNCYRNEQTRSRRATHYVITIVISSARGGSQCFGGGRATRDTVRWICLIFGGLAGDAVPTIKGQQRRGLEQGCPSSPHISTHINNYKEI